MVRIHWNKNKILFIEEPSDETQTVFLCENFLDFRMKCSILK